MNSVTPSEAGATATEDEAMRNAESWIAMLCDSLDDADLRSRMESDAAGVLAERDIELPPGVDVRFVHNSPDTFHFVVPPDPNREIADGELAAVAGGIGLYSPPPGLVTGPLSRAEYERLRDEYPHHFR